MKTSLTTRKRWTGAVLVVLVAGPASAATTPAQKCGSGKNQEAGKYAACRQKAEAAFAIKGDSGARAAALERCQAKYGRKWTSLEAKAAGACPSVGDQAAIQAAIDVHTDDVASALAGGTLSDCNAQLATCAGGLAVCDASLTGTQASLVACEGDLTAAQDDLTTCLTDLAACEASGTGRVQLLRTGQTQCWDSAGAVIPCAGTGQDGELQLGLAHVYVDNGNGTITDTNTGLTWEKNSDDGSIHDKDNPYAWADAFAVKVATLNAQAFGGHTDWRLPNLNELRSLAYQGTRNPAVAPAFNTSCVAGCTVLTCSCTASGTAGGNFYWTSTALPASPANAFWVTFLDGNVNFAAKTDVRRARAVRGGS